MNDASPGKEVATKDPTLALLEKLRPQLEAALPKHLGVDRFLRVSLTTIRQNPKLMECDRRSFLASMLTCAQLGLEPDGVLGQAYLVPFKTRGVLQCQLIVGYRGYVTLARNSGEIESIQAKVVRKGDEFHYQYGFDETLTHIPKAPIDAPITHAWLVVKFKNGGRHWDVMTREDIDRHMLMSQGYQRAEKEWEGKPARRDSPWHLHYAAMAVKTVVRANARFLPLSVQKAAALDDAADMGAQASIGAAGEVVIEGTSEAVDDPQPPVDEAPEKTPEPKPEPKAEAPKPKPAEAKPEPAKPAAADPRPEPPPASGADPWDDDIGNIPANMDRRGKAAEPETQPAAQPPIDGAQTPAAAKPAEAKAGRPARKAANVPPPGQSAAKPKDPFTPTAGDTADEYVARVRKQLSSAISGPDYKRMENLIDWNWLAQKDSLAHDALISFCEEREDYYNRPPKVE